VVEPNEHEATEPEATEPTLKHPLWLRLAILPLAAALVAVLLLSSHDEAAGKPVKKRHGITTQGLPFELGVDAEGRASTFSTTLVARCPSGHTVTMPWDSADGEGVRFRRDGDRLRVAERSKLWELVLDGRFDEKGSLSGSLRVVVRVKPKTKPAFACASKNVRFTARP
jgi:hypothetical protein